jgi:CRISPR-associated protein Cas1
VEDLAVVIIDSPRVTLTSALLASLQAAGAAVVICNARHIPAGLLLPFHQHSRQPQVASLQAGWSRPFRKRCWQFIVRQKIKNQAQVLNKSGSPATRFLHALAGRVDSGDSGNMEAQAAQAYWKAMWGEGFVRATRRAKEKDRTNAALNFGYAVARAVVSRSLVAHGLLPCFGLHHDSQLNAFNLADDMLEPLRPVVDRRVREMAEKWGLFKGEELKPEDRQELAALGGEQVLIRNEAHSLLRAADIMAQSLVRASEAKDPAKLELPTLAV